jgi:hypothetical protein
MGEISINLHGSTMKTKSKYSRSHKSKHSLHSFHFNPLRFLGMFLIEKNQERREQEREKLAEEQLAPITSALPV